MTNKPMTREEKINRILELFDGLPSEEQDAFLAKLETMPQDNQTLDFARRNRLC